MKGDNRHSESLTFLYKNMQRKKRETEKNTRAKIIGHFKFLQRAQRCSQFLRGTLQNDSSTEKRKAKRKKLDAACFYS